MNTLKNNFDNNRHIVVFKHKSHSTWRICTRPKDLQWRRDFDYKLIAKHHKHILEAYFNDRKFDFEWYFNKYGGFWQRGKDFIDTYDEKLEYRLRGESMKKEELNNTWCEATKENYDVLVANGIPYEDKETWNDIVSSNGLEDDDIFIIACGCFKWFDESCKYEGPMQIHLVNGQFEYVEVNFKQRNITGNKTHYCSNCERIVNTKEHICDNKENNIKEAAKKINKGMSTAKEAASGLNKMVKIAKGKSMDTKNNFKEYGFEGNFNGHIHFVNVNSTTGKNCYFGDSKDADCALYWVKDGRCFSAYNGTEMEEYNLTLTKKPWYEDNNIIGKLIINKHGEIRKVIGLDIENCKVGTYGQNLYSDALEVGEWRPLLKEEALSLIVEEGV